MANIDDAFRIEKLSLNDNIIIVEGIINPSTIGYEAPIGSLYFVSNSSEGDIFHKIGVLDTNWTKFQHNLELYTENFLTPTPPFASGVNSVAIGSGAQALSDNSLAIGDQSLTRIPNSIVYSGGRFGSTGDAQSGKYFLRTNTINGTSTEAFIDGTNGSIRLTLTDDSTWSFSIMITAHQTNGSGHAGYKFEGVIYRESGANTIAFQGSPIKTVLAESDPVWDANIQADTTNGSLRLNVIGETGKIIRWLGVIDTVELTN